MVNACILYDDYSAAFSRVLSGAVRCSGVKVTVG